MTLKQRLKKHLGKKPRISRAIFVAGNATIVGDVVLAAKSSVFYGAVLRGDINSIRVGEGTNIQDNVVLHLSDDHGVQVGSWCTVGHGAVLHACRIGDECLIGMGAVVLDGAAIGARSIVGASALVAQRFTCPDGSLVLGAPARVVRLLRPDEIARLRPQAEKYTRVAKAHAALAYRSSVKKV